MSPAPHPDVGFHEPATSASLLALPPAVLNNILALSGDGGARAALACRVLSLAWREVLNFAPLAAQFLVARYGVTTAARHIYTVSQRSRNAATREGHDFHTLNVLRLLIQNGAKLELHEALLLTQAARAGHSLVVSELLARHSVRSSSFALSRALTGAVEYGNRVVVRKLLAVGAPPSAYQSAALVAAASAGHVGVVYDLCMAGADVTADSSKALRHAVQRGHVDVAAVLLQYGADPRALCSAVLAHACTLKVTTTRPNAPPASSEPSAPTGIAALGGRSFSLSTSQGQPNKPTTSAAQALCRLRSTCSCGPDNTSCCTTTSPASCCSRRTSNTAAAATAAATAGSTASSGVECSGGSDALRCWCSSSTAAAPGAESCCCCCCCGAGEEGMVVGLVEMLLRAGADPRAHGRAALEAAAERGHASVVRMLLAAGADPAACNSSALVAACVQGHLDVVCLLLEAGADPWDVSELALNTAAERGHRPVVLVVREAQKTSSCAAPGGRTCSTLDNNTSAHVSRSALQMTALLKYLSSQEGRGSTDGPMLPHNLGTTISTLDDYLTSPSQPSATATAAMMPPLGGKALMRVALATSFKFAGGSNSSNNTNNTHNSSNKGSGAPSGAGAMSGFTIRSNNESGSNPRVMLMRVGSTAGRPGRPLGGPLLNLNDPQVAAAFLSQL